jgi:hypothetical protein
MWIFRNSKRNSAESCERACDALERSVDPAGPERVAALGALLAQIPEDLREHVDSCEACRVFAGELLEARVLLAGRETKAGPGPYFLTRVMTSIADRELQLEKSAQTWAAVPRLAYRLSVLASLVLLIAGSWVYRMPAPAATAGLSSQPSEGLVDAGAVQDDLLVSSVGR